MYSKMPTEFFFQALDGQLLESFNRYMGKNQEISPVYLRIIRSSISFYIFDALSLLVYKTDSHLKDYNSRSALYFFMSGASLKVANSSFKKQHFVIAYM